MYNRKAAHGSETGKLKYVGWPVPLYPPFLSVYTYVYVYIYELPLWLRW